MIPNLLLGIVIVVLTLMFTVAHSFFVLDVVMAALDLDAFCLRLGVADQGILTGEAFKSFWYDDSILSSTSLCCL